MTFVSAFNDSFETFSWLLVFIFNWRGVAAVALGTVQRSRPPESRPPPCIRANRPHSGRAMFSYNEQLIGFAAELQAKRRERHTRKTLLASSDISIHDGGFTLRGTLHQLRRPPGGDFLERLQEAEDRDTERSNSLSNSDSDSSSSSISGLASPVSTSCGSPQTTSPLSISNSHTVHGSSHPSRSAVEASRRKRANHKARAARAARKSPLS